MSRKGGTGVGEQMDSPKGFKQMGVSAVVSTKALIGTGMILFGINGFRNKLSHFVEPPLTAFKGIFSLAFLIVT